MRQEYNEEYSDCSRGVRLLRQGLLFYFHGKEYVLRISYPLRYVNQVTKDFTIGFVLLSTLLLTLFSILTWMIINHFTKPIQKIIQAILPYQKGESSKIAEITVDPQNKQDEFAKLANTLNSLSEKVEQQINTLVTERKERELLLESL